MELVLVDVVLVLDEVDAGVAPVLVVANCEGELTICGGLVEYITGAAADRLAKTVHRCDLERV